MRGRLLERPTLDEETGRGSSIIETAKQLIAFTALASGAFYALARLLLSAFYADLAVSPEEVGWDTRAVLSRFALPWVVLLLVGLFVLIGALRWRSHVAMLLRWSFGLGIAGESARIAAPLIILVSIVLPIASPFLVAAEDFARTGERIHSGHPVSDAPLLDLFPVQASCVLVRPSDPGKHLPAGLQPDTSYLYLGDTATRVVVYDYQSHSTVRVPTATLVMRQTNCSDTRRVASYELRKPVLVAMLAILMYAVGVGVWTRLVRPLVPRISIEAQRRIDQARSESEFARIAVRARSKVGVLERIENFINGLDDLDVVDCDKTGDFLTMVLVPSVGLFRNYNYAVLKVFVFLDGDWLVVEEGLRRYGYHRLMTRIPLRGWGHQALVSIAEATVGRPAKKLQLPDSAALLDALRPIITGDEAPSSEGPT